MMAFIMFDYDEDGNIFNEVLVNGVDKPEKVYKDRVDHYGDIRDNYQTMPETGPHPSTFNKAGIDRVMNEYVCSSEYEGAFVGTIEQILEWQSDKHVVFAECEYYEVGKKTKPIDLFKESK